MFERGHARLGHRLTALESACQGFNELADTNCNEEWPDEGERAHYTDHVVVLDGHVHSSATCLVVLPEEEHRAESMHEAAFSSEVEGRTLVWISIAI